MDLILKGIVAVLLCSPLVLNAQSRSSEDIVAEEQVKLVEELSAEGIQKYRDGEYEEALSLFKQALAIQPVTNLLFNVGLTCERMGLEDEAILYYQRFISSPDVPAAALTKAREKLGRLTTVRLAREEEERILRKDNGITLTSSPANEDGDRDIWGWAAVGGGGAFLVMGVTFAVLAGQDQDAFDASDILAEKRAHESNATHLALVADISLGLGVAAVATGTILLILDGSSSDESASSGMYLNPIFSSKSFGLCAGARF